MSSNLIGGFLLHVALATTSFLPLEAASDLRFVPLLLVRTSTNGSSELQRGLVADTSLTGLRA